MRVPRTLWLTLAVLAIPLATVAAVMAAYLTRPASSLPLPSTVRALCVTAALCAAYASLLLWLYRRSRSTVSRLSVDLARLQGQDEEARRRLVGLEERLEVLSAFKNVTGVLTSDVGFERILDETLRITADLIGSRGDDEIAIFLRDAEADRLEPKALLKDGQTRFGRDLARHAVDRVGVQECVTHRQTQRVSDGEFFILAVPLTADRETIGAVRVRVPAHGDAAEIVARAEHLESNLAEILGTLALAIKTPDLYTRTITDALTGLYTKRHFLTELEAHFETARRHGDPLALIMCDIDHFKAVNDTYGHVTGDVVLKGVAGVIRSAIRAYAMAFRYGGEEMAIIVPRANASAALAAAERIRRRVEAKRFNSTGRGPFQVTLSLGIAEYTLGLRTATDLVTRADDALYRSKDGGRNRSTHWVPAEAPAA